jgi:hypothetical protein
MSKVRIPAILAACLLLLAFSDRSSASILVIADLYVDFRTTQFPQGDIRGVLQEVVPTPEPVMLPLLGFAVSTIVGGTRWHRWPKT